jgi:CARDB
VDKAPDPRAEGRTRRSTVATTRTVAEEDRVVPGHGRTQDVAKSEVILVVGTLMRRGSRLIAAGAVMAAAGVVLIDRAAAATSYDLVVTSVTWTPPSPAVGQRVDFSATVTNAGGSPTPSGTSWRLSFSVDGTVRTWVSTSNAIAAGATVTLTAVSGSKGVNYWTATAGTHSVTAVADDQNRLRREVSESNNQLSTSLVVGTPPPPPADCRGTATVKVGPTRGGFTGFANGFRYSQLSAADRVTYMDAFAATGGKWFRMNMEDWDLSEFQDVVAKAKVRGLCVIGNLSANATGTHWGDPPDHQASADQVVSRFVNYLKADVNVWEVWNEANISDFWPGTSESYVDLLHRTHEAIHAIDSDAMVLGGGLAPSGNATDPNNAVNFWTRVYNWNHAQGRQGSAQLFDGLAHHPYLFPEDPLAPGNSMADWNAFYQTYLIHQLMSDPAYGGPTNDGAKRIWATEAGFPTGCSYSGCITLQAASTRIPAQLDKWINEWGSFTGAFLFYELQDQPGVTGTEHFFGFLREDWSHKDPMYTAFTTYAARTN